MPSDRSGYCREVEAHLCRKNDGHLIRIVGPAFELVSRWAEDGVPLKVAFRGIDRYFERYYRKGPRRRPVRVDFCDADVREVFDEWRRAVGVSSPSADAVDHPQHEHAAGTSRRSSLPAQLERAVARLTSARVAGTLGEAADRLIDLVSQELDAARASSRGLRGEVRQALIARLRVLDAEILGIAHQALDESERRALDQEAQQNLAPFRDTMTAEVYHRACQAAIDELVRTRFNLPILTLDQ